MNINLETACKTVCPYCKMGMPLGDASIHRRPFGEFMDAGTDNLYPCKAAGLRQIAQKNQPQAQKK